MPYVTAGTLSDALEDLRGTAEHFLKIWLTLKQMGLDVENPVKVNTRNPTYPLQRLFAYGHPNGRLYVPFAHTKNLLTMAPEAGRSIVQTMLQCWLSSGSVVTVDPTNYLTIEETVGGTLMIRPGRAYPEGLGQGKNGFALKDNTRVTIPLVAFGVWYYRQEQLPEGVEWLAYMQERLKEDLHLSQAEVELIFVDEHPHLEDRLQGQPLSDDELYQVIEAVIEEDTGRRELVEQTLEEHAAQVRSMANPTDGRPHWTFGDASELLERVLQNGSKAVLLYGPPRMGKTRQALKQLGGKDYERIQIHEGWGYDELMVGLRPKPGSGWDYVRGPLLKAIRNAKTYVILEEINHTDFSQAIGEVFSLLEEDYRGPEYKIKLRNGDDFLIPKETVVTCTMNPLDRSTENVDDALFARMDAVEFPPRVEGLIEMLEERGVTEPQKWRELFGFLQDYHPMGQGYFAPLSPTTRPLDFYCRTLPRKRRRKAVTRLRRRLVGERSRTLLRRSGGLRACPRSRRGGLGRSSRGHSP